MLIISVECDMQLLAISHRNKEADNDERADVFLV